MSKELFIDVPSDYGCCTPTKVFIRTGKKVREILPKEWKKYFPEGEPVSVTQPNKVNSTAWKFVGNFPITIAKYTNTYERLHKFNFSRIQEAKDLIQDFERCIKILSTQKWRSKIYKKYGGDGLIFGLLPLLDTLITYVACCRKYPHAKPWSR